MIGDMHGNSQYLCNNLLRWSEMIGCDRLIVLGDFGFLWPGEDTHRILDKLDRKLEQANQSLLFLPGNHEDHTKLDLIEGVADINGDGHFEVRPRIHYTGRVNSWDWDGKRFGAVGGAVSIDRQWRLEEMGRGGPRSWWPQETLSPDEIESAKGIGRVDVLLTHDAPTSFPLRLKPDLESTANRQVMTDIGRALRPSIWFHGHYHVRRTYRFPHDEGGAEVHSMSRDESEREYVVEFLEV